MDPPLKKILEKPLHGSPQIIFQLMFYEQLTNNKVYIGNKFLCKKTKNKTAFKLTKA